MKKKFKNYKLVRAWLDECARLIHEEIKNNPPPVDVNLESQLAWRLIAGSEKPPFILRLKR